MPINVIKDRRGRTRYQFEFSRAIDGSRVRARKLLPAVWTRGQADAYDWKESARLYAEATGVERKRFTIGQAVSSYLDERAVNLKHGKGVAQELKLMLPWYTGRAIEDLADVCAKFTADNREAFAPATIRNRLRYLTAACRWGWKHHAMGEQDPAARVVMPAVSNERQVYADRREMLLLAKACPNWEVRAMIRIAFYSGMRKGEILRAEPIDVPGSGWVWSLGTTKNGDPRIVPMHPRCRVYSDYAWPTSKMVNYWFNKARVIAGMEHLTFHDLRHSAASAMINNDVDLYTVGAVLGHKSSASTKRYAHLATTALRAAVGKIGRRV